MAEVAPATLYSGTPSPVLVHIPMGSGLHTSNNCDPLLIKPGQKRVIMVAVFVDLGMIYLLIGRTRDMEQAKNKVR